MMARYLPAVHLRGQACHHPGCGSNVKPKQGSSNSREREACQGSTPVNLLLLERLDLAICTGVQRFSWSRLCHR
jgi:hypothetical protein